MYLFHISFSVENVTNVLLKLKPDSAAGPDKIPSLFLRKLSFQLALPLSHIFNASFKSETVPSAWLRANVTAIFKKGSSADRNNYRPISLTSIISKVMERLIHRPLLDFLRTYGAISKHQHGFLSKKSTLTQLLECTNDWSVAVADGNCVDVAYLDLAKAFDSVSHPKLLYKLEANGISGNLLGWLRSFLSNRQQRVVVDGKASEWRPVTSGVPQGTILGPLLFLIFINDMVDSVTHSSVKLYADDSKIYHIVRNNTDSAELQSDLDSVSAWSKSWQLNISISKCSVLHIGGLNPNLTYCIDGVNLENCRSQIDLGVTISSNLKPCEHIARIASKAYQRSHLTFRSFKTREKNFLKSMFCVYIRPILEYDPPAWSPSTLCDIDRVENVQRSFTRRIPGLAHLPYVERLQVLELQSLEHRRLIYDIVEVFKCIKGFSGLDFDEFFEYKQQFHNTRGHPLQLAVKHSYRTSRNSVFAMRVVPLWNSLTSEIVASTNVSSFKYRLKNFDFSAWIRGRTIRV